MARPAGRPAKKTVYSSVEEYAQLHGLEPLDGIPAVGEPLVHLVRNGQLRRLTTAVVFAGKQHDCTVVTIQPNRIKVKFGNGIEKVVKHISLYRRKS